MGERGSFDHMNISLIILEVAVVVLGLGILLADLWTPKELKPKLGYIAAAILALILLASLFMDASQTQHAFLGMYILDGFALFFKRFFLLAAIIVLIMSVEYADRIESGIAEYYALMLFALSGMMIAASANDFIVLFVSLELITISFYILTSFQRARLLSLEAGVKYLILGALASAFTVYGIALVFGMANTTNFGELMELGGALAGKPVFLMGLLLVLVGLGFKMAAFPFQIWAPDVYQGAPVPSTAFLAVGSKAAGVVLLLRVLFSAVPEVTVDWNQLLMVMSGVTILYGNLCAIPQRSLKRLLGYSSIAHAGYILMGVAAMNLAGSSAILYYLAGYLFTVLAAFMVIAVVMREMEGDDLSVVAGLHQRSPLLAGSMALAMISLAGIPPLAGFFGKFLLLRAVLERGALDAGYYWLIAVAIIGVIISFYYYLGVVRVIYWSEPPRERAPLLMSDPSRLVLCVCVVGMLYLGIFPNSIMNLATQAARALRF
jgi:NADH-quinone oxidoreductase subunit N